MYGVYPPNQEHVRYPFPLVVAVAEALAEQEAESEAGASSSQAGGEGGTAEKPQTPAGLPTVGQLAGAAARGEGYAARGGAGGGGGSRQASFMGGQSFIGHSASAAGGFRATGMGGSVASWAQQSGTNQGGAGARG